MKKLLFKSMGYGIALSVALCLLPSAGMSKTSNAGNNYWQAIPVKTVVDQIATYYKVNIAYENRLLENKTTTYQFNPAVTNLSKALQDLLRPIGLKLARLDNKNFTIISQPVATNNNLVEETAQPQIPSSQIEASLVQPSVALT